MELNREKIGLTNRRRFIQLAGTSVLSGLAGCASGPVETPVTSRTSRSTKVSATKTEIFVAPDGSDRDSGDRTSPVESIQEAINRAYPGDTIRLSAGVHTSGEVGRPMGETIRPGDPDNPISIHGPPDAIVRGPEEQNSNRPLFDISHSHIHLVGMTLDGLTRPEAQGDAKWYRSGLVAVSPPTTEPSYPDYLTDIKIKPRAIGNARKKLISVYRTNHVEIGEFDVIGPAGVDYFLGDEDGWILGAVVSLGRSGNNFGTEWYPWEEPDESHDIHVHHIANLEGHHHTELVETHGGNYDIKVEYCTNRGGFTRRGVLFDCAQSTCRWNVITAGSGPGIVISTPPLKKIEWTEEYMAIPDERFPGVNNSIYGNRIDTADTTSIVFQSPDWFDNGPSRQDILCGNELGEGEREGFTEVCGDGVPTSEVIGHLGGDSPWA